MDNPFESPSVISFCPGILGIERGLKRADVDCRVVTYVEIEAFICANLVAGMEACLVGPAPIWTDAKTFDARPFRGRIHGIIGGYPCPGESLAGLREGHLYKGFLWPAIRRAIAAARPLWAFFENVDDHLTGTYPIVQRSLRNMGYAVEVGIYTAAEIGATHERKRVFILAIMADTLGAGERPETRDIHKTNGRSDGRLPFKSNSAGEKFSNAGGKGLQRMQPGLVPGQRAGISGSASECRPQDFPLGEGFDQWGWEEPREIEPGMGSTAHGYDFDGDILRALGNSVVEQTAEIAFISLLNKHLNS